MHLVPALRAGVTACLCVYACVSASLIYRQREKKQKKIFEKGKKERVNPMGR